MEDWCYYSDMPSPQWWDKKWQLFREVKQHTREDLVLDLEVVFQVATETELGKLQQIIDQEREINLIFIELDFICAKLKYFKRFPEGFTTSFGIDLELIPNLLQQWRDEKLKGLDID